MQELNARGDELGPNGTIIRKREEIVSDHYGQAGTAEHSRPPEPVAPVIAQEAEVKVKETKKVKVKADPVPEAVADLSPEQQKVEKDLTDDWVEDADGNFVQKGS